MLFGAPVANAANPTTLWTKPFSVSIDPDAYQRCDPNYINTSRSIASDSAGNVYVTGCAQYGTTKSALVMKRSGSTGALLWYRLFSSAGDQTAVAVALDTAGNPVVIRTQGEYFGSVSKLNAADGSTLWESGTGGRPTALTLDGSGNVLVTGRGATSTPQVMLIAKFDGSTGSSLWSVTHSINALDNFYTGTSIATGSTGEVFVTGYNEDGDGFGVMRVARYAGADGSLVWNQQIGDGTTSAAGHAIAVDGSGNVIAAGTTGGANGNQGTVVKWSAAGTQLWWRDITSTFGGVALTTLRLDSSGNALVSGTRQIGSNATSLDVHKLSASTGNVLWTSQLSNTDATAGGLVVSTAGDVLVVGSTRVSGGEFAMRAARVSGSTGATTFNVVFGTTNAGDDIGGAAAIGPLGQYYIVGAMNEPGQRRNLNVMRIDTANGTTLWSGKEPTEDRPAFEASRRSVVVDDQGHVFVGTMAPAPAAAVALVVKVDRTTGNELWRKEFAASSLGKAFLRRLASGAIVVAYPAPAGNTQLQGLDAATGNTLWQATPSDLPRGLAVDGLGEIHLFTAPSPGSLTSFTHLRYSGGGTLMGSQTAPATTSNSYTILDVEGLAGSGAIWGGLVRFTISGQTGDKTMVGCGTGTDIVYSKPSLPAVPSSRIEEVAANMAATTFGGTELGTGGFFMRVAAFETAICRNAQNGGVPDWSSEFFPYNGSLSGVANGVAIDSSGNVITSIDVSTSGTTQKTFVGTDGLTAWTKPGGNGVLVNAGGDVIAGIRPSGDIAKYSNLFGTELWRVASGLRPVAINGAHVAAIGKSSTTQGDAFTLSLLADTSPVLTHATSSATQTRLQPVTFTVSVSGGATGTVSFAYRGTNAIPFSPGTSFIPISGCQNLTLTAGSVTCTTSSLPKGIFHIQALYSGDATFSAAAAPLVTQTVVGIQQTITFAPLDDRALVSSPFTVNATGGGSAQPVTFASTTPMVCSASGTNGSTITLLALGTCILQASQADTADYAAATPVLRSFTVANAVFTLSVSKSGSGTGTVTSAPAGIDCGTDCDQVIVGGTTVTLTATPGPMSAFGGWTGTGCGMSTVCDVTMNAARAVTATFTSTVTPPVLIGALSRKSHGMTDLNVTLYPAPVGAALAFEPRVAGGNHRLVLTFDQNITSIGSITLLDAGMQSAGVVVMPTLNTSTLSLVLPSLPDGLRWTLTLVNLNGSGANSVLSFGTLVGDLNHSGRVTAADLAAIKARRNQSATGAPGHDLNLNGSIDIADETLGKSRTGRSAP